MDARQFQVFAFRHIRSPFESREFNSWYFCKNVDNIFSCIFNFIYLTIKFLSCPDIINYLLTESEVCVAKNKLRPCCIDQVIERSMRQSRSLILPVNTESSRLIVIKILLYSICFSKTTNENIRFGAHPGTPVTYFNEGDFLGL